jgi:transcription elongation factor GreB
VSKAFTKDDAGGEDELPPYAPPWPEGARNYITPEGHARLLAERAALVSELPSLVDGAAREAHRRLQILDVHLAAAEVVPPPSAPTTAQFGVTVRVDGARARSYTIVGVDEVDAPAGRISWLSPIARALRGCKVGDVVMLSSPRGEEELEIVALT